jgi:hypothetical protein
MHVFLSLIPSGLTSVVPHKNHIQKPSGYFPALIRIVVVVLSVLHLGGPVGMTGLLGVDSGGGGGCHFLGGYVYILSEEPFLPVLLPLFPR